jgi:mono/diheme cytochrome c family protein
MRMSGIWTISLCTTVALAAARAFAAPPDASASFEKQVRPVIVENCLACHNPEKKKGDVDLSRFETTDKAMASEEVWRDVADRLRARDMPPRKAKKQPTEDDRKAILAWIDSHVARGDSDCTKIATDKTQKFYRGYVMSRRLTRAEYNNTIRDLIGIDFHLADDLPADGSGGEGFDTDGDALFTSAISLEKYLKAAEKVMGTVLPDDTASLSPRVAAARQKILVARPGEELSSRGAARQVVSTFAQHAFRRPASGVEADRLLALFDRAQQRGDSYEASLRYALKAVLISPNFLFLVEPEPSQEGVYRLGDFQLATRLSYFLWSSTPDEELFSVAAQNRLHEPDVLKQQVRRIIADPKSAALGENFAQEWLGIQALGGASRPDSARFPDFNDRLVDAERQELVLFFNSVIHEDHSLTELIDANYTFANDRLANLYGLEGVSGSEMRRVTLSDRNRGGVLGMAAVLTSTSYPLRTSPVLRGKWVLEQLLGERIPPPPPTAGQLPPDDHQSDGLTFRQRLEKHRANAECASCHSRMDPLGFGLENFDAIGRWRTTQSGEPIDSSGVLPGGERFAGPRELKDVLLKHKDQFLHNFSRKLLGYALGRGLNRFDECVVSDAVKEMRTNGERPSSLIETITLSAPFQYRYAKK